MVRNDLLLFPCRKLMTIYLQSKATDQSLYAGRNTSTCKLKLQSKSQKAGNVQLELAEPEMEQWL